MRSVRRACSGLLLAIAGVLGWSWARSYGRVDIFYTATPTNGQSLIRGVGTCRGGILWGSLIDPQNLFDYKDGRAHHQSLRLAGQSVGIVSAEVDAKRSFLGFGAARGRVRLRPPLSYLFPARPFEVRYVPIWAAMLLALMPAAWLLVRRRPREARTEESTPRFTAARRSTRAVGSRT